MFSKDRLVKAREAAKMSKAELADKSKLSLSAIQGYEADRRKPNADQLAKLAEALDVSADYLLGLVSEPEEKLLQQVKAAIREAFGPLGKVGHR